MKVTSQVTAAQKLLDQYRKRDGVPTAVATLDCDTSWLAKLEASRPVNGHPQQPAGHPQQPTHNSPQASTGQQTIAHSFLDLFGDKTNVSNALVAFCTDYGQDILLQAPLRLYLLMRHMDADGRGYVMRQQLVEAFTTDKYGARLYGSRRLRQVLAQGDDIFWQQAKILNGQIRVSYRRVARVLHALGIERVGGGIATVPVSGLLVSGRSGQATANAHLFAGQLAAFGNSEKPVSRRKLRTATGFSPRRQRSSQRRVNGAIRAKRNIQIHSAADQQAFEELAWAGKRPFLLTDYRGKLGRPFSTHVATMLPNSYTTDDRYKTVESNHERRISNDLKVLRINGGAVTGSSGDKRRFTKLFHGNADHAVSYARKRSVDVAFYPATLKKDDKGKMGVGVWENAVF